MQMLIRELYIYNGPLFFPHFVNGKVPEEKKNLFESFAEVSFVMVPLAKREATSCVKKSNGLQVGMGKL